jgi:hypothetical protein
MSRVDVGCNTSIFVVIIFFSESAMRKSACHKAKFIRSKI